ncbi:expressed unknown protein [Seminavis robusta]|uniref:Uncharacterized protein n=1 Tax=Seminavis robusta TaxID=568900 RepID=A0A9N8HVQ7_9STRA|nr:expressed unknown protein [Seminavis robusta]|eukprot:Sro2027_g311690.1 n/a (521) ;mRNA; f:1978-3540
MATLSVPAPTKKDSAITAQDTAAQRELEYFAKLCNRQEIVWEWKDLVDPNEIAEKGLQCFIARPFGAMTPSVRSQLLYEILTRHPHLAAREFGGSAMTRRQQSYFNCTFGNQRIVRRAFPLLHLLAAKAPLSMIQEVYDMYPDVNNSNNNTNSWLPPLHVALLFWNSVNVVSFLISKDPQAVRQADGFEGNLPLHCAMSIPLNLDGCVPQKQTNQQQTKIQILVDQYPEAILTKNKHERTPLHMALVTPRLSFDTMDLLVRKLPPSFQELEFHGEYFMSTQHCRNLIHFLSQQFDRGLHFHLVHCTIHANVLHAMFSAMTTMTRAAVTMKFCNLRMEPEEEVVMQQQQQGSWNTCRVQKLVLDTCTLSEACLQWLPARIRTMEYLTDLSIWNQQRNPLNNVDMTEFAMDMLLRQRRLEAFCMSGFALDTTRVAQLLATNPTLTTDCRYLEDLVVPNYEIHYYSVINRHGRGRITDTSIANRPLLVECLAAVQADYRVSEHTKTPALYGLLRAAPGLWSPL